MARREIATSAVLAVAGVGLALWLAANRAPSTPVPPTAPEAAAAPLRLPPAPERIVPVATAAADWPEIALGTNGLPCGPTLVVAAGSQPGLADVIVSAPCHAGGAVDVGHGPIRFSEKLTQRGTARWVLPVIDAETGYTVRLGGASLRADPLDVAPVLAVSGLSWSGAVDPRLSALEFGAARGGPGHVMAGKPGAGRVFRYGSVPRGAKTTFYIGPEAGSPGRVRLVLDLDLSDETCAAELPLGAFTAGAGSVEKRDIRLTLPPCDEVPASLQLKNLLADLTLLGR